MICGEFIRRKSRVNLQKFQKYTEEKAKIFIKLLRNTGEM